MQVQKINNNNINSRGLYFTRYSNVLFNKNPNLKFMNPVDVVKESEHGFRYVENKAVSQNIKDRFLSNSFIKELSEKFDTFIFFVAMPKEHPNNTFLNSHFSFARIMWADLSKTHAEQRLVTGRSAVSQEYATDKMFKNLANKNFNEIG